MASRRVSQRQAAAAATAGIAATVTMEMSPPTARSLLAKQKYRYSAESLLKARQDTTPEVGLVVWETRQLFM